MPDQIPTRLRYQLSGLPVEGFPTGRIEISHPYGLSLVFNSNHPKLLELIAFGAQCVKDLENEHALEDWSI